MQSDFIANSHSNDSHLYRLFTVTVDVAAQIIVFSCITCYLIPLGLKEFMLPKIHKYTMTERNTTKQLTTSITLQSCIN